MGTITNVQHIIRVQNFRDVEPSEHFFFDGVGHERVNINDGQPDILNAKRSSATVSGRLTGIVRITPIKGAIDWYSLRSIGLGGRRHTVYVKGDALVVLDGETFSVSELYEL